MKRFKPLLKILPGVVVLALIGWSLVAVLRIAAGYLRSVNSGIAVAIIAAAATGLVSVITLALTKAYETRASIRQDLRAKKVPVYEEFIQTIFKILFSEKLGQGPMDPVEMTKLFATSTEKLTIWASDDLIKAFGRFKSAVNPAATPTGALFQLEDLMLAIRKDLAIRTRGSLEAAFCGCSLPTSTNYWGIRPNPALQRRR